MSNAVNYKQNGVEVNQNIGDVEYLQQDPFINWSSPIQSLPFPTSNLIKLQPRKVSFQPNTLGNTTHIYTSPVYQDIKDLAAYFGDWSCAYEIQEGAIHTVTVQIPWDTISQEDFNIAEFASEQWELVPNQDQKSLVYSGLIIDPFQQPTTANNYVVLPDVLKVGVTQALENKSNFIAVPSGSSIPSASFIPVAQQILSYMRFGVEGVPSYTQTLKRTAVIDTRNTNNAFHTPTDTAHSELNANGSINFIRSTPDMFNSYGIPEAVKPFLMPSYSKKVSTTYDVTPRTVYAGWLVKPPSFQFITRNKVQLTQEFIWNEWLGGLYYIASNTNDFGLVYSPATNPNGFSS